MILTFNTTDITNTTDRTDTRNITNIIGPQSIDELKIKATFEPLLKSLLKEPFEPLLRLLVGFLTFLFKEVLVDSIDGLYSIADSALHWFLESEYQEIHDILETFEDDDNPDDPETNSDLKTSSVGLLPILFLFFKILIRKEEKRKDFFY